MATSFAYLPLLAPLTGNFVLYITVVGNSMVGLLPKALDGTMLKEHRHLLLLVFSQGYLIFCSHWGGEKMVGTWCCIVTGANSAGPVEQICGYCLRMGMLSPLSFPLQFLSHRAFGHCDGGEDASSSYSIWYSMVTVVRMETVQ